MKYIIFVTLGFLAACATVSESYNQGIEGKTVWLEGDRMPGPDQELPDPSEVSREVVITPLVKMDELPALSDGLYPDLPVNPVATVESDENGVFRVGLPPGRYSVFTKEDNGYFASSFDSEGNVNPVEVPENDYSEITIEINYKAVF